MRVAGRRTSWPGSPPRGRGTGARKNHPRARSGRPGRRSGRRPRSPDRFAPYAPRPRPRRSRRSRARTSDQVEVPASEEWAVGQERLGVRHRLGGRRRSVHGRPTAPANEVEWVCPGGGGHIEPPSGVGVADGDPVLGDAPTPRPRRGYPCANFEVNLSERCQPARGVIRSRPLLYQVSPLSGPARRPATVGPHPGLPGRPVGGMLLTAQAPPGPPGPPPAAAGPSGGRPRDWCDLQRAHGAAS